jgi:hypothetical protein
MTGAPLPRSPQEQVEMAPEVYNFKRNFAKTSNTPQESSFLQKTAGALGKGLILSSGLGALYGLSQLSGRDSRVPAVDTLVKVANPENEAPTSIQVAAPQDIVQNAATKGQGIVEAVSQHTKDWTPAGNQNILGVMDDVLSSDSAPEALIKVGGRLLAQASHNTQKSADIAGNYLKGDYAETVKQLPGELARIYTADRIEGSKMKPQWRDAAQLTGRESRVETGIESDLGDNPQINDIAQENEQVSIPPSRSGGDGGGFLNYFLNNVKNAWDDNTQMANDMAKFASVEDYDNYNKAVESAAQEVLNNVSSSGATIANPANFEAVQRFDPRPSKSGGGMGVESIGYRPDGFVEINWHGPRNPEKQTEGGYIFDGYVDELGKNNRDALVTATADPALIKGKIGDQGIGTRVSDARMDEIQAQSAAEMEADETVLLGLKGGRFGYGEGQVSPGKFAQAMRVGQPTALEFLRVHSDQLRG